MWSHPWPHTRPAGYPQVWAAVLQWDYLKASLSSSTGKPVAEGHSFGLQGIGLEETDVYIPSSDTLATCAKCSASIKGRIALLVWGQVAFQLKLEGRLRICQTPTGTGYSTWRHGDNKGWEVGNDGRQSWSLSCHEGRDWSWITEPLEEPQRILEQGTWGERGWHALAGS